MKKTFLLGCAMVIFLIGGCSKLSEDDAEKLVIDENSNQLGEATIISSKEKDGEYYIEWENKQDKSKGTSKVSADGEVTIIESEIE